MKKTSSGRSRTRTPPSQPQLPQLAVPTQRVKLTFNNLQEAATWLSAHNPERSSNLILRSSSNGTGKITVNFDTTL